MARKETLTVSIDIVGKIDSFSNSLKQIEGQLGRLKIRDDLADGVSNTIKKLNSEITKITELTSGGKLKLIDEKSFQKSISNIENLYNNLINTLQNKGINTSFLKEDVKTISELSRLQREYGKALDDSKDKQKQLTQKVKETKKAFESF